MADDQLEKIRKEMQKERRIYFSFPLAVLVIGTLSVALILYLSSTAWEYFKSFISFLRWLISYKHPIAGWIVAILVSLSLFALAVIVKAVQGKTKANKYDRLMRDYYTKDKILGVIWRWRLSEKLTLEAYMVYCPECDAQLSKDIKSDSFTVFFCPRCKFKAEPINGDLQYVTQLGINEITRKIRNGEWIAIAKRNREESKGQGKKIIADLNSED